MKILALFLGVYLVFRVADKIIDAFGGNGVFFVAAAFVTIYISLAVWSNNFTGISPAQRAKD